MDCHRCLAGQANLVELSLPDGGAHKVFLCERCLGEYEADASVERVSLAPQH